MLNRLLMTRQLRFTALASWWVAAMVCLSTQSPCAAVDPQVESNTPADLPKDRSLALTGGRLIDGDGGPPLENATVIIRGSKIEAAGPRDSIAVPANAERVDLDGMTIVPGFVDCHFHSINDLDPPRKFLSNGVTTLRDPGHPFRFYQAALQSDEPMPRLFLTGGHLDAYPPIWPQQARIVGTLEQARQAVEDNVRHGATAIKIYFRLPRELITTVCETAHGLGVPVTAHLELVRATDAIESGIDGVEHVTSFGTSLASDEAAERFEQIVAGNPKAREDLRYRLWADLEFEDSNRLRRLLDRIIEHDVIVSPTLAVFERSAGSDDVEDYEAIAFARMLEFVGRCHQAGATIVAGSHTWVPGAEFGLAFQRELELLVASGLTPLEAITAGTRNGARFLQTEHRLGTIEPGKLADLVVVAGNPAEDIRRLRDVRRVMLHGRWIERK